MGKRALVRCDMQSTFEVHWGKHHRTYVNNLNNQIQGKDLESKSLEEVC